MAAQDPTSSSDNALFTAIVTGISSLSPLSTDMTTALITHLPRTRPLSIALLGSDLTYLESTITKISTTFHSHPDLTLLPFQCTLTSAESLGLASHQIRETLGAWDLFIHYPSAHVPESSEAHIPATVRGSDEDTWWGVFELNVHALHHVARHFFSKMKRGATFVNILPVSSRGSGNSVLLLHDRASAEHAAALAAAKVVEYLAAEHVSSSGLTCVNVGIEKHGSRLLALPPAEEIVQMALS